MLKITDAQLRALSNEENGPPTIQSCPATRTWIAIRLVDADDNPIPGERYQLRLPDATEREGMLNQDGRAYVDDLDPGTCQICFPDIDAREWSPA